MPTAKQVINSTKSKVVKGPGPTQKGSAGYDNPRDDIEKVKKIRELIVEDLTVHNDISMEFGDLVSEVNPDGADAIRIKGTDYVDVVLGGMAGYFAVWNVADTIPVFFVNERGDTDITGELHMNTNKIIEVVDPTQAQDAATKKYVDDYFDPIFINHMEDIEFIETTSIIGEGGGRIVFVESKGGTEKGHIIYNKKNAGENGIHIHSNSGVYFEDADGLWMEEKIGHRGNQDTYIQFTTDRVRYYVGGVLMMDMNEIAGTDTITFDPADTGVNVGVRTSSPTIPFSVKEKGGITVLGGYAIKLTNKTGSNSVQGQVVIASTTTNDAFAIAALGETQPIGVVLKGGVRDGSEEWVVVSGIADVLIDDGGTALGDRLISSDNIGFAGSADVDNAPAVAVHFQEIGHCIEGRVGAGLARAVIHFL